MVGKTLSFLASELESADSAKHWPSFQLGMNVGIINSFLFDSTVESCFIYHQETEKCEKTKQEKKQMFAIGIIFELLHNHKKVADPSM